MEGFVRYNAETKIGFFYSELSGLLIHEIAKLAGTYFSNKSSQKRSMNTQLVKDCLAKIGWEKYGCFVYANGLSPNLVERSNGKIRDSEWVFDLHWQHEGGEKYTISRIPMAMECEWQQTRKFDRETPFSAIKYDLPARRQD